MVAFLFAGAATAVGADESTPTANAQSEIVVTGHHLAGSRGNAAYATTTLD